jgi:hypothetical protein
MRTEEELARRDELIAAVRVARRRRRLRPTGIHTVYRLRHQMSALSATANVVQTK